MAGSRGALSQRLIALGLLRTTNSKQLFDQLAANSIRIAEHSIGLRDMRTLGEVSEILSNLLAPEARQAGIYYHALAMKRRGLNDEAQTLLERIADRSPATYRARAMQTLGVIQQEHGDLDEAARFYIEAIRAGNHDLITTLSAKETMSAIKSAIGDHSGALADLEDLWPLFRLAAKQYPFSFYLYHADLAYELGQVNRIAEAEAASAIALASPFASAYPEWSETRDEIAAKRVSATPSVIAIHRAPEANVSPQVERQCHRKPSKRLSFYWSAPKRDSFQRALILSAPAAPTTGIIRTILDRIRISHRASIAALRLLNQAAINRSIMNRKMGRQVQ